MTPLWIMLSLTIPFEFGFACVLATDVYVGTIHPLWRVDFAFGYLVPERSQIFGGAVPATPVLRR
jgi:hypothetical protein